MKKKIVLLLLILLLIHIPASAQSSKDSLWNIWTNTKLADTTRIKSLNKFILDNYLFSKPDSAFYYSQIGFDFSKKKELKKYMAIALNFQGISSMYQGNYNKSLDYYKQSLSIRKEINDKRGAASNLNNIGIIYRRQSNYDKAIESYTQSLLINKEINDKKGIASAFNNLGSVYYQKDDYINAIKNYTNALTINQEVNDYNEIASNLNNIGNIYMSLSEWNKAIQYFSQGLDISKKQEVKKSTTAILLNNLGTTYKEKGDYNAAITHILKAISIKKDLGNKYSLAESYNNLASTYLENNDTNKAKTYYEMALQLNKEIDNKYGVSVSLNGLGMTLKSVGDSIYKTNNKLLAKQKYDKAISYSEQSITISKALDSKSNTRDAAYNLYEAHKATKNNNKALKYFELYVKINDSLLSDKNQREVLNQEYKYEYEKKVAADEAVTKERIKQEKDKRTALYVGLGLLSLFIFIIYNRFQKSQKQKQIIQNTLSDLKLTQNQLVQSEKMAAIGVLTAGIAHEINNPINFIGAGATALNDAFKDFTQALKSINVFIDKQNDTSEEITALKNLKNKHHINNIIEEVPEILDGINIGVERTTEIVKGLLLYSHTDNSLSSNIDIHESIDLALTLLTSKFKNRIEIVKNYDTSIPQIECYPSQLNQVFTNLISNAIDAISDKGTITITTKSLNKKIQISILDTGSGIPNHIKQKIFDPFFTTKEVGSGTGLGLSICQGIIKKHKGTIDIKSEVNKGTEIIISLPLKMN